jgi:hypothetical protein
MDEQYENDFFELVQDKLTEESIRMLLNNSNRDDVFGKVTPHLSLEQMVDIFHVILEGIDIFLKFRKQFRANKYM